MVLQGKGVGQFIIHRRVYIVEGTNSLWHIDGNQKLIKWHFVIHGDIDGYTRTIVFLTCSTNNLAATVMSSFNEAVCAYGVPGKVRSDLGGENIDVWRCMVEQRQSGPVHTTTMTENALKLQRETFLFSMRSHANQNACVVIIVIIYFINFYNN